MLSKKAQRLKKSKVKTQKSKLKKVKGQKWYGKESL